MKKYALIVAGGKGIRMGAELPKQFLPLAGKPLLMHTLHRFWEAAPTIELILVLPESQMEFWRTLCEQHHFELPHKVVAGGESRFHSVKNGLAQVTPTDALVAVHDGVRPLLSPTLIQQLYQAAALHKAVVPTVPAIDSLRQRLPDGGNQSVDRAQFQLVQTPQIFQAELLCHAYEQPYQTTFTDDASVVEAAGSAITLAAGERENLKITTPLDLAVAEILLASHVTTSQP